MSQILDSYETNYSFINNNTTPLVFIHGVGLNHQMWEPQINFLKEYSIITYDLLGHGKTPFKNDEVTLNNFSNQAHKLGLLPGQANGVVKFYNDMQAASLQEQDSVAVAARENSTKELKQEWGQAYDQKINQASNLAQTVGASALFDTNLADGTKLGDHPVMIKAFAELASKMGEDTITQSSGPVFKTPEQIEKDIGELTMPGSAYWDKHHPNHQAAVAEVLALREKKNQV